MTSGRDPVISVAAVVGGFCAAFLVYVVAGSLLAIAIVEPQNDKQTCWPHRTYYAGHVATECANPLADAVWRVAIETPRNTIAEASFVVTHLHVVASWPSALHARANFLVALEWALWSLPLAIGSWLGYRAWRLQSPTVATTLVAALAVQILLMGLSPGSL
jgi:hypothetical protein